jgi:uncharacterized heparinase superfamily protein
LTPTGPGAARKIAVDWGLDRWRLYRLGLGEAGRVFRARLAWPWLAGSRTPRRLLLVPQDLRTAEPTIAGDIYAGIFVFAGRALQTGGRSPFAAEPPSRAWSEALYGFGWLRHLRAAQTGLARSNARALVQEFLRLGVGPAIARTTSVRARRLTAFLNHSPLLLEGADHGFYRRFLATLGALISDIERDLAAGRPPVDRLLGAIALANAGLCCEGLDATLRRGTRLLTRELDRQILPDGGHIGRNPRFLVELLLELLPLRQTYASRGLDPPEAVIRAIDRLLPMLRLFRHGDGSLARFNGSGVTEVDHLATVLLYDEARGTPQRHAPHAGYERLEGGRSLLVADVGPAPPLLASAEAHAGALSFELSSGPHPIIVNCGAARGSDRVAAASRSTAAHSTAGIGDASSGRFLAKRGLPPDRRLAGWLIQRLGPVMLSGPRTVTAERGEGEAGFSLVASHDGYLPRFGLIHERRWRLARSGDRLEGEDRFRRRGRYRRVEAVTLRFHLHPSVRASRAQGGRAVVLVLPNREAWQFEAGSREIGLEESVFFAGSDGQRRTEQLVLQVDPEEGEPVLWRFERLTRTTERRAVERAETPTLL